MSIRVDQTEFKKARRQLMRRTEYRTMPEFLTWRSKIISQRLVRMTPPMGGHPLSESWPEQKKRGEATVKKDIAKVFAALKSTVSIIDPKLRKAYTAALRKWDMQAIDKILRILKVPFKTVIRTVVSSIHKQLRNSRGTVPGKQYDENRNMVISAGSLTEYIRKIVARVGYMKWGWGAASIALGAKQGKDGAPGWVTRHAPGGSIEKKLTGLKQHIKLTNDRPAGRDPNSAARFCAEYDKLSVIKELKAKLDWAKYGKNPF